MIRETIRERRHRKMLELYDKIRAESPDDISDYRVAVNAAAKMSIPASTGWDIVNRNRDVTRTRDNKSAEGTQGDNSAC